MKSNISAYTKNIKKNFKELQSLNSTIESYFNILNNIKEKHNIFDFEFVEKHKFEIDQNVYFYYDVTLYFNIEDKQHSVSFLNNFYDDLEKLRHNFPLVNEVFEDIEKTISIKEMKSSIGYSGGLHHTILQCYWSIDYEESDFVKNSNFIIDHFKSLLQNQIINEDNSFKYAYIKLRKISYSKSIHIVYSEKFNQGYLQIKLPELNNVLNLFLEHKHKSNINYDNNFTNFDSYNKKLFRMFGFYQKITEQKLTLLVDYENIFKQEMIRLNQDIFNKFNISEKYITFEFKKNRKINFENFEKLDYSYFLLKFNNIHLNEINLIPEQIILRNELINF